MPINNRGTAYITIVAESTVVTGRRFYSCGCDIRSYSKRRSFCSLDEFGILITIQRSYRSRFIQTFYHAKLFWKPQFQTENTRPPLVFSRVVAPCDRLEPKQSLQGHHVER